MDSSTVQSQVHEKDEQHPHHLDSQQVVGATHGEEEHQQENKSVMNKVKAKARSIKDSIKKHGQQYVLDHYGKNEHQQHTPDHDHDDLNEKEDKEKFQDPQVDHEAPIYDDSEVVKSATPAASQQGENLDKSGGIDFEGAKVMGEEPHHDSLVDHGVSSPTEIDQNIATHPAKTSSEEERQEQLKVNSERPIVLEEDPRKQGSRPEADILPNYQTKVTDPSGAGGDEIKDITAVEKSSPKRMNVHNEPKPTTEPEIQSNVVDNEYPHPTKTFATEEKQEQSKASLERPVDLEEDPHELGSRPDAYTLPNYQTKVINPTGAGSDEIKDNTAVDESFERMNVQDEPKPTAESKIQSTVADTKYPHPAKTFDAKEKQEQRKLNFERPVDLEEDPHELGSRPDTYALPNYQTKATNPTGAGSDEIKDNTAVEESFERMNVQDEPKPTTESKIQSTVADTKYPHPAKTFAAEEKQEQRKLNFERPVDLEEDPHEQGSRPDTYALPNYQTKATNPTGAGSDEMKDSTTVEESFERMNVQDEPKPTTESKIQSTVADNEYAHPAKTFATEEKQEQRKVNFERPVDLDEDTHEQGSRPDAYALPNYQNKVPNQSGAGSDKGKDITATEDSFERMNVQDDPKPTAEPKIQSNAADTEYPPAGSHVPHLSATTGTQNEYPQETLSSNISRNPEIGLSTGQTFNAIPTRVEKQPPYESGERQSKDKSYIDETEISDATGDETLTPEIDEASKLGHDEKGERNDRVKTNDDEQEKSGNGSNEVHSLTENLAPVYGGGGGGETETKKGMKDHDDKGVSVTENLAEKLRPGEEDKALSELNSEALHKPKEEPEIKKDGELGSGDEKSEKVREEIHVNSPEKGMVGKVTGYVGSWFSKSDENQSPKVAGGEDLSKN